MKRKINPETEIMRGIRDYLRWTGWFVLRLHQGLGSSPGTPDLYALKNGRSVWIEVKRPGLNLTPTQQQFFNEVTSHKGEVVLFQSIEDAQSYFKQAEGLSALPGHKP